MALDSKATGTSATGRRWFFGTNVTVMILLAACILVAVDWIANRHNYRMDLAGGFASYRVSQRSENILAKAPDDLQITTVYTSDEPESDRKKYLPKLRDFCDELKQVKKSVSVEHLYSGKDRAELRNRVQGKFGTATADYETAVQLAKEVWDELSKTLGPQQATVNQLLHGESWLGGFSTLANIATILRKDLENLKETGDEVETLVRGEGIPRYKEANTKIKSANDELKQHIEETQDWMKEMDKLAKVLSDQDSDFIKTTRAKLEEMKTRIGDLKKIAGDPSDQSVPEDTQAVIKAFAKTASGFANWLSEEFARVSAFAKENPAIGNLPDWQIRQMIFVTKLPSLLADTADSLSKNSMKLRQVLQDPKMPKDQLQNVVRQLRSLAREYEKSLNVWATNVTKVFDDGANIEEQSKSFLAAGTSGDAFAKVLERLNEVSKKIDDLPELALDDIAERLQQDNIVVVETEDDVQVVSFDEVWPYADPMGAGWGMNEDDQPRRRVFDGDAAVSNAILGMEYEKPFATVILVAFEFEPQQQMRQMQPPTMGPVPLRQVNSLKEKLKAANFVVKDWNLGDNDAAKPEPDEGTKPIYVLLPPGVGAQNPFARNQMPPKNMGDKELKQVKEALGKDARAIFLTIADARPPSPFSPPVEYAYEDLLRDDWGIDVEFDYRVIRGVRNERDTSRFGIDLIAWMYMPLTNFTEHAIGKPLRARRVLMREVCPILKTETPPEGVKVETILDIPETAHDVWAARGSEIQRIAQILREGRNDSTFEIGPEAMRPPFPVMIAAENEKTKGKIVVTSNAFCYRDDYLTQRIMRFEGARARLITDPPPTENLDLLLNTLYWLSDRSDLIASGPAPVPVVGAIEPAGHNALWLITVAWAFVALVVGGVVMSVRRK